MKLIAICAICSYEPARQNRKQNIVIPEFELFTESNLRSKIELIRLNTNTVEYKYGYKKKTTLLKAICTCIEVHRSEPGMKGTVKAVILCIFAVASMTFNSFAAEAGVLRENEAVTDSASYELMIGCVVRTRFTHYQEQNLPLVDGYSQIQLTGEYHNMTDNRISIYDALKMSLNYDNQYVSDASQYLFSGNIDYIEPHSKEGFCIYITVPDNVVRQTSKVKLTLLAGGTQYSYGGEIHDYMSPTSHDDRKPTVDGSGVPGFLGGIGRDIDIETVLPFGTIKEFHTSGIIWVAGTLSGLSGENNIILHWVFPDGSQSDTRLYYQENGDSISTGSYISGSGVGSGGVSIILESTGQVLGTYGFTIVQ